MSSTDRAPRLPENYRIVLAVIDEAGPGSHLTAQGVWLRARERQLRLGFATVHRALARLHDAGAVLKIDVPGVIATFYETVAVNHAHLRCRSCGSIVDVQFSIPREELAALEVASGVRIDAENVTFTGRCADCSGGV